MPDFTQIPILDYTHIHDPTHHHQFLLSLRNALINIGFLYLSNPPLPPSTLPRIKSLIPQLFSLPQSEKDEIAMVNNPHFLGYTSIGREFTKGERDWREQFDFAPDFECRWPGKEGGEKVEEYVRLWGPAQWPRPESIPDFKPTLTSYSDTLTLLGFEFIQLIAESLGLPSNAFDPFYDHPRKLGEMQHRFKIVKYPEEGGGEGHDQGVGPHFDAGFLTFLFQASDQRGLQVQNFAGDWIDVPPIPNTLVVNIGKALETASQGLLKATSHRVLSPPLGSGPRYSVPWFQNISQSVRVDRVKLEFPEEILLLKNARGDGGKAESVNFSEYTSEPAGLVSLLGRVKSHPDVGERHYPALFQKLFPNGPPETASAY